MPAHLSPGSQVNDTSVIALHSPPSPNPKKRRRPALACERCRRRKIKCDHNTPCNNCISSRSSNCSYPPTHTPVHRVAQADTAPLGSGPRAGQLAPFRIEREPSRAGSTSNTTNAEYPQKHQVFRDALSISAPARFSDQVQSSLKTHPSSSGEETVQRQIKRMEEAIAALKQADPVRPESSAKAEPNGPRFSDQTNWLNNTTMYRKVLKTLIKAQAEKTDLYQTIAACKVLGQRINGQASVENTSSRPDPGTNMPERYLADKLLDIYLSVFEGLFRVLHIPSFLAEYKQYWEAPNAARELFVLQLQVCMALGAAASQSSSAQRQMVSQWLLGARSWLSNPCRVQKLSFEELQLCCLVCVAEANDSGTEQGPWFAAGDLVRKAMSLNLHRESTHLGSVSLRQTELSRRLWITILELNLLLSLKAGRPPLLSTSDYNAKPPEDFTDEELSDERNVSQNRTMNHPSTPGRPTQVALQRAYHKSFPLRLKLVSRLTALGPELSYEEVLQLHTDLSKANLTLQQVVSSNGWDQHRELTDNAFTRSQKLLADILFSRYLLALHLPVLGTAIKNPAFHFSRRVSVGTAVKMMDACGILRASRSANMATTINGPNNELDLLFFNSAGVFRHIAVHALFALILEFVTCKEEEKEGVAALPVWDESELLRRLESAQEWAELRIRTGLTDVHNCCFVASCTSYGIALGSVEPVDVDETIVEAALSSGERCLKTLGDVAQEMDGSLRPNMEEIQFEANHDVYSALPDISADWIGDLMMGGMADGFAFDWTDQLESGTIPVEPTDISFMSSQ